MFCSWSNSRPKQLNREKIHTHTDCSLSMLTDEHDQKELNMSFEYNDPLVFFFLNDTISLTTFLVQKMLYFNKSDFTD